MTFYEVQFPMLSQPGTKGVIYLPVLVVTSQSLSESRLQLASRSYYRWQVSIESLSLDHMTLLEDFFDAIGGKTNSFRFFYIKDYQALNEPLPYTSGTILQLQRVKTPIAGGPSSTRIVTKPQENNTIQRNGPFPVVLYRDGVVWPRSGNWSIDLTTGIITLTADQTGHTFSADFQYDIPARLDIDALDNTAEGFNNYSSSIPIMEIPFNA